MRFLNKAYIVTGGASGIGLQIVDDLLREKARVYILDIKAPVHTPYSVHFYWIPCDVRSEESILDVFDKILKAETLIGGLVNSAGINPARQNIVKTSHKDWEMTIKTNLTGSAYCSAAAIRMMSKYGGSIVNISSVAGLVGMKSRAAYSASKAGLIGLTRSMAVDFGKYGIRVNCVCPGYVRTELTEGYLKKLSTAKYNKLLSAHPLRGHCEPKDISAAVLFLLSEEASRITGAILPVDGGYSVYKE